MKTDQLDKVNELVAAWIVPARSPEKLASATGSKLSADTRYVECPGCGVRIDLGGEGSWRRIDGPCEDGHYWCMDRGCNPYSYTCGCVPEGEEGYLEGITKGFREDGQ